MESTTGDRAVGIITSTHTILTARWDSTQQLKVLETQSTHALQQISWVEPPDTRFVSNLDRGLTIPGGDITGLVALSLEGDSAISRVGSHPSETTTGDRAGCKITSTHTILTARRDST